MHKIFILTFLIIGNKLEVAAPAAWCYCVGAKCGASVAATKNLKTCAAARSLALVLDLKDASNKYLLYLHRFNFIYIYGTANI